MRLRILLITGVLVFLLAADLAFTYVHVRSFRHLPNLESAGFLFRYETPGRIIGRHWLFRPGTKNYLADLRSFVYTGIVIADLPWNRALLARDAASFGEFELDYLRPGFPVSFDVAMLPVVERAIQLDQFWVLAMCSRFIDEGPREACRRIVATQVHSADAGVFEAVAPYALQYPELVESTLKRLETPADAGDGTSAETDGWDPVSRILGEAADSWDEPPATSSTLFEWIMARSTRLDRELGWNEVLVLNKLKLAPAQMLRALARVDMTDDEFIDELGLSLVENMTAEDAAEVMRLAALDPVMKSDRRSLIAFHHLLHFGTTAARETAKPILSGPDSTVRKGVIVLLARHRHTLEPGHLDSVFTGPARRQTYFTQSHQFFASTAYVDYTRLAGHDYNETGKRWPPAGPTGTDGWRDFIARYPWFPGTDDAYYRLAYGTLARQKWDESVAICVEYIDRSELPDRDATPFVFQVLRSALLNRPDASGLSEPLAAIRQALDTPLALAVNDTNELRSLRGAIAALRTEPRWIAVLGLDQDNINSLARVVEALPGETSRRGRLRVLFNAVSRHDSYQRPTLLFHDGPDMGPAGGAIRNSDSRARYVSMVLSQIGTRGETINASPEATLIGMTALRLLQDDRTRVSPTFQPLVAALTQLDDRSIPEPVSEDVATLKMLIEADLEHE